MDLHEAIEKIKSGDYKIGWKWVNEIRTKQRMSRADVLIAENAIAEQIRQRELLVDRLKVEQAQHQRVLDELQHLWELERIQVELEQVKTTLTADAAGRGLTLETDQEIKKAEAQSRIKIDEIKQLNENELRLRI